MKAQAILTWIKARLAEPSTKAGLLVLLSGIGISVSPELLSTSLGAVVALIGLYEVIRKESTKSE
jgi:hypothetical protein